MSTEEFLQAAKILLAHVAASAPVALQDERGKDNPSDNDGPISGLVLNTAPSIPANHGHIPLPPSYDEKYSETLYSACETIHNSLGANPEILRKELRTVNGIVSVLNQIGSVLYRNLTLDKEAYKSKSYISLFGPSFTSKICLSASNCLVSLSEHEYYDEALLCSNVANVLAVLFRVAVVERNLEASFNPFPSPTEDHDNPLVSDEIVSSLTSVVKDLSASSEIEIYLSQEGLIETTCILLEHAIASPVELVTERADFLPTATGALANLTTNVKIHKSNSNGMCVKVLVNILSLKREEGRWGKWFATCWENVAAVLRNLSADSRSAHGVGDVGEAILLMMAIIFNYQKGGCSPSSVFSCADALPGVEVIASEAAFKDALGTLRNLSTHEKWDKFLFDNGATDLLLNVLRNAVKGHDKGSKAKDGRNRAVFLRNDAAYSDVTESCTICLRNLAVQEYASLHLLGNSVSLELAATLIKSKGKTVSDSARAGAIRMLENLSLFVDWEEESPGKTNSCQDIMPVDAFVKSNTIDALIFALESDLDEETTAAAASTLARLAKFGPIKAEIVRLGGKSMVSMLSIISKRTPPALRAKDYPPGDKSDTSDAENQSGQYQTRPEAKNVAFGSKSSRFSDAFISDMQGT